MQRAAKIAVEEERDEVCDGAITGLPRGAQPGAGGGLRGLCPD